MSLVYEFETDFREIEGIKLLIRRPKNEQVSKPYSYQKRLSGASTVSKLSQRINSCLGHWDLELLDEYMDTLHGSRKLDAVREKQWRLLPGNRE